MTPWQSRKLKECRILALGMEDYDLLFSVAYGAGVYSRELCSLRNVTGFGYWYSHAVNGAWIWKPQLWGERIERSGTCIALYWAADTQIYMAGAGRDSLPWCIRCRDVTKKCTIVDPVMPDWNEVSRQIYPWSSMTHLVIQTIPANHNNDVGCGQEYPWRDIIYMCTFQ